MRAMDRGVARRAGRATTASYTALPSWVHRSDAERAWQCTSALEQSKDTFSCPVHQLCGRAMASNGGGLSGTCTCGFSPFCSSASAGSSRGGQEMALASHSSRRPVSSPLSLKLSAAEASAAGRVAQRDPTRDHETGRSAALPRRRRAGAKGSRTPSLAEHNSPIHREGSPSQPRWASGEK